jgi:hypothetical protein
MRQVWKGIDEREDYGSSNSRCHSIQPVQFIEVDGTWVNTRWRPNIRIALTKGDTQLRLDVPIQTPKGIVLLEDQRRLQERWPEQKHKRTNFPGKYTQLGHSSGHYNEFSPQP